MGDPDQKGDPKGDPSQDPPDERTIPMTNPDATTSSNPTRSTETDGTDPKGATTHLPTDDTAEQTTTDLADLYQGQLDDLMTAWAAERWKVLKDSWTDGQFPPLHDGH